MSESCVKSIEEFWKAKTTAANELFNKGNYVEALLKYQDALYRAEVLNNNAVDCLRLGIPFVQVYIISCNNVAYTYEELNQKDQAENMLKRTVFYLLQMAGNKEIDTNIIQSELKRAALSYVRFVEKMNNSGVKKEKLFKTLKEQSILDGLIMKQNKIPSFNKNPNIN